MRKDPDKVLDFLEHIYQENQEIKQENQELRSRLQKLEGELAKYTSLHIPSSKQIYPKKRGKSSGMPLQAKQKRGGSKKGKTGITWDQGTPDQEFHHRVEKCVCCNIVADPAPQKIVISKRILEIPEPIEIQLQEHHIYQFVCPKTGKTTQAGNPTLEGTSLGPNLLALVTTSRYRTGGSFENIAQLIADNSTIKPSQTTMNRGVAAVSEALEQEAEKIGKEVMNSDWVNIDETSHKLVEEGKKGKVGSKKIWTWTFATANSAYYKVELSRGQKVLKQALEYRDPDRPPLIAICDCYPAYMGMFEKKQLCWAHLLRNSKEFENHCQGCTSLHDELVDLYQRIEKLHTKLHQSGKEAVTDKIYQHALNQMNSIGKPQKEDCKKSTTLRKRLRRLGEFYLTCLQYPDVAMTNNHAERLLKSVILHRSNGKSLRSKHAMKLYGNLLTVLTTWKLQKRPLGETLRNFIHQWINKAKLID